MAASFGQGMPSIKVEQGAQEVQGPHIKQDPDTLGASPAAQSEDDIYEDAGDLDFTGSDQSAYLARLPKFLWEVWSKLDDDQEITIGRVRIEGQPNEVKRMSIMLDPQVRINKDVPKEYNMHLANKNTLNTFIFSEKDMTGYKRFQADNAPMHWVNRKRIEKKKNSQTQFRKAIPKQTWIRGKVHTEVSCQAVENGEYDRIMAKQAALTFRPKSKIQLIDDTPSGNVLAAGNMGYLSNFSNFVGKEKPRKKGERLVAARMPLNDLLDLLFSLFQEYTYWSMSALKQRVHQPEAYLKDTLEKIAFIAKAGPHVSQWQLKDEVKQEHYATLNAKDEAAPEAGLSFDGGSDFEMDDVDMEDVNME